MDPFTLIVAALLAGAAAGGQDAAQAAVRDAYSALRRRVSRDGTDAEALAELESSESATGGDRTAVEAAVRRAQVSDDPEVQELARLVLAAASKHVHYDLRHAQGVHAGDGGTVNVAIHNSGPGD